MSDDFYKKFPHYYFDLKLFKFFLNKVTENYGIKHKIKKIYFTLWINQFKGETTFDIIINRKTFENILKKIELFVQQYNNVINVTKYEYSMKKITDKYNNDWNNKWGNYKLIQ